LADGRTWRYVIHNAYLLGGVQYDLPGLFKTNPWPNGVNGSLWTLPVELTMYIWVALLGVIGVLGHKAIFNLFAILICLFASQFPDASLISVDGSQMNPLFFLLGAFCYINRESILLNIPTLLILGLIVLLTHNSQLFVVSKAILFAYLILFVALNRKVTIRWLDRMGDISYGVYIYAFPVQQATALLIPSVEPTMMFVISLPITLILAVLSWRFAEKPCLALKGKIPMGRRFLDPRVNG
jgi:peptidoglycan/LPS O-acetylase OafA/YrhL